jgi:flagellar hook-basal body complex protein FliE
MTSIAGISGITGALGPTVPTATTGINDLAGAAGTTAATGTGDSSGFAAQLAQGLENLQGVQAKSDDLAVKAATGSLTDVHDYTIAATEASLATKLTVAVRDKAVGAFNEIMRMQG